MNVQSLASLDHQQTPDECACTCYWVNGNRTIDTGNVHYLVVDINLVSLGESFKLLHIYMFIILFAHLHIYIL